MSVQFLVIMVPVVLGMMGFAVDLGRLYLIRGELNQAASAMAMAAASQLNGTIGATDLATTAANSTLDTNQYNFGSVTIGQGTALLESTAPSPAFFDTVANALAAVGQTTPASTADGTTARHVTMNLSADAPLLFWSLLTLGQSRKTSIAAAAVAGVSAPVCTACGIDPYAIAAVDSTEPINFGFTPGNLYTLGFNCNGNPALLPGTTAPALKYLIIDRYNTGIPFDETQQLFRTGSQGLLPATTPGLACSTIGNMEAVWATTITPTLNCAAGTPNPSVQNAMCGLSARMTDPTQFNNCNLVTDIATLATAYTADTDVQTETDYTVYTGNNRRVLTLPIVDALSTAGTMTVLGFRQFLLQPTTNFATASSNNPSDGDSRFVAMYLGVVAPVKQGSIGPACGVTSGPGKVVLHQ